MSVHAHKILNQLRLQPMSKEELKSWVTAEFGENAQFRTCSKEGFDFESILEFFLLREKVVLDNNQFKLNEANVCSHN
ncbi:hypothetical protein A9264_04320 [Vibrio sp. UCD-FRSSP16_10]|uniref:YecH family metal-binding protein n=1 Tax=unclassified Vibrio TaxID=2614977 RepID=UPI0008009518|nr:MULTISPECIES: YecH family metal-binding protein [unclassified Vibrio]OBT10191.1 hypothetical protein A9260_05770 [Vibrio sp. UCD-FRSSP16_30]OBT18981.1 hypothetical protein A9264_04320 [Vibrio sp. UCD-FRSSP16_10]